MKRKIQITITVAVFFVMGPEAVQALVDWEVYSDNSIIDGDDYLFVDVYDTPPDTTTLDVMGGHSHWITAHDESTINISGGTVVNLENMELSTSNITGGELYGEIWTYDQSTVNLIDGDVNWIWSGGNSTVNLTGGESFAIRAQGNSHVNISDGQIIERLIAFESSIIDVFGYGFQYDPSGGDWDGGQLIGLWQDGTPFSIDFDNWTEQNGIAYNHVNLHVVPEPATLAFFLTGVLLFQRRKMKS